MQLRHPFHENLPLFAVFMPNWLEKFANYILC